MTRIVFFGTSNFAATILKGLKTSFDFEVVSVVTQPDKPVGRKREIQQSAVARISEAEKTLKPITLKDQDFISQLKSLHAEVFVVAAYGKIIPKEVLDIPAKGCVNVHGSILPKYRGASPIQTALANGDQETGVTIMLMDEQVDHGDVLAFESLKIGSDDTYTVLEQKMADLGQNLLLKALPRYLNGLIPPFPQDHSKATYTKIIEKQDGHISWDMTAKQVYDLWRAYSVWPGIWTTFEGKTLKIIKCSVAENLKEKNLTSGKVFEKDKKIYVVCGKETVLEILEVQPESGKLMDIKSFVAGRNNFVGSHLGPEII